MEEVNLETRVLLLEKEMEWKRKDRISFKEDFQALKEGVDKLTYHMIEIHKDLGDYRAHTDERISTLQAHTDAGFVEVHREFAGVHGEISGLHREIAKQTRWILAALLTVGTMISFGLPIAMKLVDRLMP